MTPYGQRPDAWPVRLVLKQKDRRRGEIRNDLIPPLHDTIPGSCLGAAIDRAHVGGTKDPSRQLPGALDGLAGGVLPDPYRLGPDLFAAAGNVLDNHLHKVWGKPE